MGWPAFWSEIVIVVLGVAIALAANQAVEDWTWRNKVEDAETRLQGDVTWAFLWAAEKYVSRPCVDAQLAALGRNVLESTATLKPVPVLTNSKLSLSYVVRMANRPYRFPVWEALLADGTASHFASQRQAFLGRISDEMAQARSSEAETRSLMGRLMVMRDPIELDPVVRADLLTQINQLRSLTAFETLNAQQRMRRIVDAGRLLADDGAAGITTTCGFLCLHQSRIADALPVPFASSSLLQSIFYVVAVEGGITVAAIAHTKRKPGYWLRRV